MRTGQLVKDSAVERSAEVPEVVLRSTRDPDEAAELMRQLHDAHPPRFLEAPRPAEYAVRSVHAGNGLRVDHTRNSFHFQADFEGPDNLVAVTMLRGTGFVATARNELRSGPGDTFMQWVGIPGRSDLNDFETVQLHLPFAVAAEAAEERAGIAAADLRFEGLTPVSLETANFWAGTVGYVRATLFNPDASLATPLVVQHLIETVARASLLTFPNNTMGNHYTAGPGKVESAAVRRAVAYIEENSADPVTVDDIAAAAGISSRGLRYAFRQHLDTTPAVYLRRVRLANAHKELMAADPTEGTTVQQIAARWGYVTPGTFARHYQAEFGMPPSRTLHT